MVTIGLVDDHTLFRNTLTCFINHSENCRVILEAENGKELQEALSKNVLPDILLLDLYMPVMDGFEAMQWLHKN